MADGLSADQLQAIASFAGALPVAVWVGVVPSGECVFVNTAFREILGVDPPEGAARGNYVGPYSVHALDGAPYPEDRMPFELAVAARALVVVDDMVIHRHDGGRTFLRVYARPMYGPEGAMSHIVEAFTDITAEVLSARVQREREAQILSAQRMDSLGGLAGGIAHDFNNLLMVIKMIASQIAATESRAEVRQAMMKIDEVTDSATSLTRALLGFARQGKNLKQVVGLNDVAERVVGFARRTIGRAISIETELHHLALDIEGDPVQVEQLLMNLVVNAKDAIRGVGTVTVRTGVEVVGEGEPLGLPAGRYAVIEVRDTGTGIPAAVLGRVFEPYFTTKTGGSVKGTGLGLATVFGIVESHQGSVSIARTGPDGTVMRVLLPVSTRAASPVPPAATVVSVPSSAGRVLVVDDDVLVVEVIKAALEVLGYEVRTAADGVEAVGIYAGPDVFDAVILDMIMPIMGGRETYLALRAMDPGVKVLLITGYALNHEAQEILDLGVKSMLSKPFSIAQLSAALARVVGVGSAVR